MRVELSQNDLEKLFNILDSHGYTLHAIASELVVNRRTVFDWKRSKYMMPFVSYKALVELAHLQAFNSAVLVDPRQQKSKAGKIGGRVQWLKNGSIGTLDDKRLGGKVSYENNKVKPGSIFRLKAINRPAQSEYLAEFFGIMIGDGSLTKYQASISLNMTDDFEFVGYTSGLIKKLFCVTPAVHNREKSNCSVISVSSKELVTFLHLNGLPVGDKIRGGLSIPEWIACDSGYSKACLRGIFDTDGSIFLEVHRTKGRTYSYPRLSFVSYSEPLVDSIYEMLLGFGFSPKIRMNCKVNLERFTDIEKYFKMIGSSNPKHLRRFAKFGGVG